MSQINICHLPANLQRLIDATPNADAKRALMDMHFVASFVKWLSDVAAIRLELCGHLIHIDGIKGFTLDKTRYRMRLEDETEESVRVIIERKE